MGRVSFAALVLIPLFLLSPAARAGTVECGLFADTLLAVPDTLSKFYQVRLGVAGQDLIWRDLEFMWDSLYTSGSGPSLADRVKMRALAENLVDIRGKNPFSPGPGDEYSDFQMAYEFFRTDGESYTQDAEDTTSVLLGNYDRLAAGQPPMNYNPSDRSHLDVYLVPFNRPNPETGGRLFATCPSQFVEGDEDLTTNRVNDPKPANSIQVLLAANAASDTSWTSHDRLAARTVVHEMQHGLPSTVRDPAEGEMFSQGTEVIVGMTEVASTEANNSEIAFPWPVFAYGNSLVDCEAVTSTIGLNYEMRSLFTAYLAFNLQGSDNTLADDLLRQWARARNVTSGHQVADLRRLLRNDSCVTCATTNYFPAGPGGAALDDTTRLGLLVHNFRVALYANDTTLAQGQYGYPPRFGFEPTKHYRCWQSFDGCEENDIVALPPEIVVGTTLLTADTVLVGTRTFRNNTARLALAKFGAEYWVLRSAPELLGTSQTIRVLVGPERLCSGARLMASLVGYAPPDDSVAAGRLWAHPEWATLATAPIWVNTDSLRNPLELTLSGFGTTYKAAVLVITAADGREIVSLGPQDYWATVALTAGPYAPLPPLPLNATTSHHESAPTWSPAGDELAFMRRPEPSGTTQIYRQKLDGSSLVPLTASSPTQANPDWSPRGDWVAYDQAGSFPNVTDLYVHNVNTGVTQLLYGSPDHDLRPAFSPNGQQVAFYRLSASGSWSLARVDLDGTNATTVCALPDDAFLTAPRWSPDGQQIYFARSDTLWAVPFIGGTPAPRHLGAGPVRDFDFSLGRGPLVVPDTFAYYPCNAFAVNAFEVGLRDSATGLTRPTLRGLPVRMVGPRWSLDGTRVAAGGQPLGQTHDLWLIDMTANHAPSMPMADVNVQVGVPLTINLSATDADGDPIAYRAPSRYLPPGATLTGAQFSWPNPTPASADHYVVLRALDPFGGVANKVVKIHVDGGGSGCPFVDTRTAQGWQVENSILGRSLVGAFQLDPYRLKYSPEIVDGKVHLRIRENEQELTTLDRVQLLAVDHPTGSQVFRLGERTVIAAPSRAHRVTDSRGTDLTSRFLAGAYQGHPGDTLYVDMTDPSSLRAQVGTEGVGPQAATTDEGEGGYLNGFQKPLDPEGMRHQLADEGAAPAADVQVLNETGILVEAPDGRGGWRLVKRYYPREHEAECTLDSLGRGSLRLIFVGRHALSYIGRLTDIAAAPEPQDLTLTAARHSRLGSVGSALGAGGTTTSLSPGDTLDLEFAADAVPEGKVRTYFLLSTGVYTDASSVRAPQVVQEQALPSRFALAQNKPNPFATTTTIDFALPSASEVRLEVFDLQGRLVRVLADRRYEPGYHAAEWDRRDQSGTSVGAGVYLYRLRAGSFVEQRKMVLLAK